MKQYKGYYIDKVIFHSKEDIFIKKQTIEKYQQLCRMFAEKASMELINIMYPYEMKLQQEFGLTPDEIEELEIEAYKQVEETAEVKPQETEEVEETEVAEQEEIAEVEDEICNRAKELKERLKNSNDYHFNNELIHSNYSFNIELIRKQPVNNEEKQKMLDGYIAFEKRFLLKLYRTGAIDKVSLEMLDSLLMNKYSTVKVEN